MAEQHFFIVGAQRSGSTYLYKMLEQHPEIEMAKPMRPEPKYFLSDLPNLDKNEYLEKFFKSPQKTIKGEKSTCYYEYEHCAQNISTLFPDAKIIFILRNPVDRAISNYFFSLENGIEKRTIEEVFIHNTPLPEAIDISRYSVNPVDYLIRGKYIKFINIYKKYFNLERIKIIIFEELLKNPNLFQEIFNFLNSDPDFQIQGIEQIINKTTIEKKIPEEVYSRLKEYYRDSNENLKLLINNKLDYWT